MITKLGPIDKKGYPLFIQLGDETPVRVDNLNELKTALQMLKQESPLLITDASGNEVYKS